MDWNFLANEPYKTLIPALGGTFLGAILGAMLGFLLALPKSYLGARGKNLATKHDIDSLQQQLGENTEITKKIERNYSREDFLWRSELAFRERQLSELYGPAYGYVKSQQEIFSLWMAGKMQDANFEVKKLLAKQNELLRNLIIEKTHLIEGAQMPASFVRFCTSTLVFDLYVAPTNEGMVPEPLRSDPRTVYPDQFVQHVTETTERLKKRIELLNAKYANPL